MSFDLTTLNGVTFESGAWSGSATTFNGSDGQIGAVEFGYAAPGSMQSGGSGFYIYYVNGVNAAATVSGAVNSYTAGQSSYNGHYHGYVLPTFGHFTLTSGGSSQVLYVHGFSSTSLLLSSSAYTFVYTYTGPNGTTVYAQDASHAGVNISVLSNTDLSGGPNSPDYHAHYSDRAGVDHYHPISGFHANAPFDGNPNPPTFPLVFTADSSQYTPPCFAQGSRIATPRGEVAVEALAVGDLVLTASGEARPVAWIGSRRVTVAGYERPHEVNPVRIRAGAFGEGRPSRDLRLSPGHAVYMDGVLIPAACLINGATIVQEEVETVRYFHIELDSHDVLLAEGLPCESYLDDGNRSSFANAGDAIALHGRLDPKSWDNACAPWVGAGPQLADAQARLHARAEAMGWRRVEEPDLHLMADGVAIPPTQAEGSRAWFMVPPCAELTLCSNWGVLAHMAPGLSDPRRLGVAVSEVRVNGEALALDGGAFGDGFHGLEAQDGLAWRWSDGDGVLDLGLQARAMVEVTLCMVAPSWKRPMVPLRLAQAG